MRNNGMRLWQSPAIRIGLVMILVGLVGWSIYSQRAGSSATYTGGAMAPAGRDAPQVAPGAPAAVPADSPVQLVGAEVIHSEKNDLSPALRDIVPIVSTDAKSQERENPKIAANVVDRPDPVVQNSFIMNNMPSPIANFLGISNPGACGGCLPPDTNGDVGTTQYVQIVNLQFQVFDKSGNSLYGPVNTNTIWSGFGGSCQTHNDGDPVALWDPMAQRWLISQFTVNSPYYECIAISQTADATGAWYRYAFNVSSNQLPDYPKLGVWPDGYYMSVNAFTSGAFYAGPKPYVFDRNAMLSGLPATMQTFAALGSSHNSQLPSDMDGLNPPPAGSSNYFAEFGSTVKWYKFHVDWGNPANSTFTNYANVTVAGFTQLCPGGRSCVPQLGTGARLDGLGDRFMHRLAYRNFGDHESLVTNHSVSINGVSGVRWYEFRTPSTTPTIYQQSTYQPDSNWRWMGSAAMDGSGNLAVGYSVSSSSIYPEIRYAGRLATDPLNQLSQGETTLVTGGGAQTSGYDRWGDYSAMTVDPTDDCTFFFTTEYYRSTSSSNWSTRVGSFRFSSCGGPPPPTSTPGPNPTSTPIPTVTPTPLPGGNLLVNPGFESGPGVGWSESAANGAEIISTDFPHTGAWSAWLCGYDFCTDYIEQTVTIPSNGTLSYWWYMTSAEGTTTAYDYLRVQAFSTDGTLLATLKTHSNRDVRNTWIQDTISVAAGAGRTVKLRWTGTTDVNLTSSFYIDDTDLH